MLIDTLYRTRSIGCVCGDGFSYPNKFMYSVCEQLVENGEIKGFEHELKLKNSELKRYDFMLHLSCPEIDLVIIEMDGGIGHGNKTRNKNIKPEEMKRVDKWKDNQAMKQGIKACFAP